MSDTPEPADAERSESAAAPDASAPGSAGSSPPAEPDDAAPVAVDAAAGISPKEFLRLVGIGAAIGIPAALVAAGFLALVNVAEDWLWKDLPDALGQSEPPWYLVMGLPVVGAVIVLVARRMLPGN